MPQLREFDIEFEGSSIRCWEGGEGPPLVLLHGSGPGASMMSNFKRLIEHAIRDFRVVGTDLVGYGASSRKATGPFFDVEMWLRQAHRLIEWCGDDPVVLLGHSLSGALACKIAARDSRVRAVVNTGTMGANVKRPDDGPRWRYPETREELRKQVERTVSRPELVDDAELDRREAVLRAPGYREYFERMFSERPAYYIDTVALADDELKEITCPVLFMHGIDDRSFAPEETSLALARKIAGADVHVLADCAHSVALEHPVKVYRALLDLLGAESRNTVHQDGSGQEGYSGS